MSTELSEVTSQLLRDLRRELLRLHKTLLDSETAAYEQARGSVTRGELLQLVINHEQFAWLHTISELIVRIDEMLSDHQSLRFLRLFKGRCFYIFELACRHGGTRTCKNSAL